MTVRERFRNLPAESYWHLDIIADDFNRAAEFVIVPNLEDLMKTSVENEVPTITSRINNPDLSHVIHEIWHLYIKAILGINNYNIDGPISDKLFRNRPEEEEFAKIWYQMHSALEHYYFLPKMSKELTPYNFYTLMLPAAYKRPNDHFGVKWLAVQALHPYIRKRHVHAIKAIRAVKKNLARLI